MALATLDVDRRELGGTVRVRYTEVVAGSNVFAPNVSGAGGGGGVAATVMQGAKDASAEAWLVDGSGVTQPVSAVALPLPTGAATDVTLQAVQNRLPAALVGGRLDVSIGASPASVPVTGTFWQATQPISAAALPLPAGAAQEHVTAGSYHAVRLTDGTSFYTASGGGGGGGVVQQGAQDASAVPWVVDIASISNGTVDVSGSQVDIGSWISSTAPTVGQKAMASSLPVVIASNQTAVPISAAALPLPTGAATDATLALTLTTSAFQTRFPVQGQALMAASVPVVIASNQSGVPVTGTFWQATQPVSGTFWQATQPVSIAAAVQIVGNVAHDAVDSGNPIKTGGKALLNKDALPTAVASGDRADAMTDEWGRFRVLINRPKLLGAYKFESGRQRILAAAHAATAGFFWIINPVSSGVICVIKKIIATATPTAATAFVSSPRVTVERVTFTGTPSGAQITVGKRDSTDAAQVCTVRTASTGLTLTAGAIMGDFTVPAVLTAVGVNAPIEQYLYDATDDDDYIILRAGEGLVFRQADAGTASDTRDIMIQGSYEERTA